MARQKLLPLALLLAACSAPAGQPYAPVATVDPLYALQDAQATGTAAARSIEATATAQVNLVATEARASVALAEAQTQAALPGMQTATAIYNANLVATATEGAAYQATHVAADLADRQAQRDQANLSNIVWIIVASLAIAALTVIIGWQVVRIGRAYEKNLQVTGVMKGVIIVRNGEVPLGYFLPALSPAQSPQYFALPAGPRMPPLYTAEHELERQCREAWKGTTNEVANDATIAKSWSVNNISRRKSQAYCTEDTVVRVQGICYELGALQNYGGTRGWDWAPEWDYKGLGEALDNNVYFTLPRNPPTPDHPDGALIWPNSQGQSKAKPSKATEAKQTKPAKEPARV